MDQTEKRKADHIELALSSQTTKDLRSGGYFYEPLLGKHPEPHDKLDTELFGFQLNFPLWISSMTGGTELAKKINQNLAKLAAEFRLGFGLGSCRCLLEDHQRLADFAVGDELVQRELPFFANLGLAQVETLLKENKIELLSSMLERVGANGLVVHINPMQEWFQPEGDRYTLPPLQTLQRLLEKIETLVVVKEVGQGFGKESLRALMQLPLSAIEFGAFGGTNFSRLEQLRNSRFAHEDTHHPLSLVGHDASEMVDFCNELTDELGDKRETTHLIISGGVPNPVEAWSLRNRSHLPSVYGIASRILKYAKDDYASLREFFLQEKEEYLMAQNFLRIKE